jgi:hypothetical protein
MIPVARFRPEGRLSSSDMFFSPVVGGRVPGTAWNKRASQRYCLRCRRIVNAPSGPPRPTTDDLASARAPAATRVRCPRLPDAPLRTFLVARCRVRYYLGLINLRRTDSSRGGKAGNCHSVSSSLPMYNRLSSHLRKDYNNTLWGVLPIALSVLIARLTPSSAVSPASPPDDQYKKS